MLIMASVALIYGPIVVFDVWSLTKRLESDLLTAANAVTDNHAGTIADALWNLDEIEIDRQLGLLAEAGDVVGASVKDEATGSFFSSNDGTGIVPEGDFMLRQAVTNSDGQSVGWLAVAFSRDRIAASKTAAVQGHVIKFVLITLVVGGAASLAAGAVVRPVVRLTRAMTALADGDLDVEIPATDRQDEIGALARAAEVFRRNARLLGSALEVEREFSKLQKEFVTMVSHEFRTPLTVIDMNAQRIQRRLEGIDPTRLKDMAGGMRTSVRRLVGLIESILSFSRVESGGVDLTPSEFDVAGLIEDVCEGHRAIHPTRQIVLEVSDLPPTIVGDQRLIRQIFESLVSNAIKYSPPDSGVFVEAAVDDDCIAVAVRDNGPGIGAGELDSLFKKFARGSAANGVPGTGVGLFVAKHFAELHNGSISVESGLGEGSTFTVRVPLTVDAVAA